MAHPAPLTPGGDPLVAGATTGDVGGPRQYKGAGIGQLVVWKCPACANENTGPLNAGCVHCGAGSAQPKHVGVPPVARAGKGPERIGQGIWDDGHPPPVPLDLSMLSTLPSTPMDAAFVDWLRPQGGEFSPRVEAVLYEAWKAAIAWFSASLAPRVEVPNGGETPGPVGPSPELVVLPRILVQRVITTLEATFDLPEEQQSSELLSMIAQLREILE